ncbi:MoaF N-terminal domain-containing protein [Actinomadura graeca]|uniref:MoaF N-terminal domain-containing protein n=1 Tax=Actinomadura graeca TaxID=2750812 RepID=A0ABX8QQS3_9ACTN|nr:MoaF C-terminal domain-containing protein [Actinomadura graeca]QXJ21134.1 MoaF N-terminal domain-containing protein [Actinomadura graeca]
MGYEDWESPDDLPLLAVGISRQTQYRAPFVDDLSGSELTLVNTAGARVSYVFDDAHRLRRTTADTITVDTATAGTATADTTTACEYDATVVRPGIYLVDIMIPAPREDAVAGLPGEETWAFDVDRGLVTSVTSYVHERPDGSRWVRSVDEHWFLDGTPGGAHPLSDGMVGKRVMWQYSDTDRYDHVYLNARNFAWQCVSGIEQGLTELDRTRAYEVAPDLYFFGWSEHVQPVESMLFVDLAEMRTHGRMFGWEARTGEILHHQFGAVGALLNVTTYPESLPAFTEPSG